MGESLDREEKGVFEVDRQDRQAGVERSIWGREVEVEGGVEGVDG